MPLALADVIPTQIDDSQIDKITNTFNSLYSGANTKYSYALGKEAAVSLSSTLIDLSEVARLGNQTQNDFIALNFLTISKGLYQNIDLGFSSSLPLESNKTSSGYGGFISWTKQAYGLSFKPTVYLYNINIDNVFNSFGAGLSLSVFKEILFLKGGAHFIIESHEVDYSREKNGQNLFVSGETKGDEKVQNSIALSGAFEADRFDFIVQPAFTFGGEFSLSVTLNFNI